MRDWRTYPGHIIKMQISWKVPNINLVSQMNSIYLAHPVRTDTPMKSNHLKRLQCGPLQTSFCATFWKTYVTWHYLYYMSKERAFCTTLYNALLTFLISRFSICLMLASSPCLLAWVPGVQKRWETISLLEQHVISILPVNVVQGSFIISIMQGVLTVSFDERVVYFRTSSVFSLRQSRAHYFRRGGLIPLGCIL